MIKALVCLSCPPGCRLTVEYTDDASNASVSGNRCPRGKSYAISELTDPRRIVTAVIPTSDSARPVLPVRTDKPFPKAKIAELLNTLYKMRVNPPFSCGDILLENALGTGINIISAENRN
ncbi:MAG: DUF1667 domain-containing protein [Lentisphaeria bacterium]|nr:DUF1667 domain-containing protein [Lentisphaeria bacterium]